MYILLAPRLLQGVLLQGKILVERRDAGIAELQALAVNLAVLSRPRVTLWLCRGAALGLPPQHGAARFALFRRH